MRKLYGWNAGCALLVFCVGTTIITTAQGFKTLVNFNGRNGCGFATFTQGRDGNMYGADGSLFQMTPAGTLDAISIHAGAGELVLSTDGSFYGTTSNGGDPNCDNGNGCGMVFKITPGGTLTTLHNFEQTDGWFPGGLVQATDGKFYGTTSAGGSMNECHDQGCGTIFSITADGSFTNLLEFGYSTGADPSGPLIEANDGNLYGTTRGETDVQYYDGSVFRMSLGGAFRTVHAFNMTDGAFPSGGVLQATDGNLYGTTWNDGANTYGGTVFKITPAGDLTTLYNFCSQPNCTDGELPVAGLVQATDGNLYGTTFAGGTDLTDCTILGPGCGTVFKITPAGTLTTLHNFDGADGDWPTAALFQDTNGVLYGSTSEGGAYACGTIFGLDMGLSPFVSFVFGAGKVGRTAQILGEGFAGTTAVSFNGLPANFKVRANTFLTATVPEGATTGFVTVTTPTGVLTSNVPFQVIP